MRKFWIERQMASGLALFMVVPLGWAATDPLPSAPVPHVQTAADAAGQSSSPQNQQQAPAAQQNQQNPNEPVGTAAAPVVTPEGAPASRPAGAAIAPIKQRRTRVFAIRMALIVGAAVAIGTVAGTSLASPSHPR
ncbi:MAG TPA: hypothetical protein VJS11_02370 [Acidobacteriaceae bacterium]|nr:hypothetical protein [Acidobacteriaceae bacterium]